MTVVMGLSIALCSLFLMSGAMLAWRLAQCIAKQGIPDWEDICRAILLLLALPVVLLGIKRSLAASYLLLLGAAMAMALAILQRSSPKNLNADGSIFVSMLLIGLFLYGRSAWLPQDGRE